MTEPFAFLKIRDKLEAVWRWMAAAMMGCAHSGAF